MGKDVPINTTRGVSAGPAEVIIAYTTIPAIATWHAHIKLATYVALNNDFTSALIAEVVRDYRVLSPQVIKTVPFVQYVVSVASRIVHASTAHKILTLTA